MSNMNISGFEHNPPHDSSEEFKYKYFSEEGRELVWEYSESLARHLEAQKIPNVIFVDRAARPLWIGVDEYWNQNFQNEKKPGMYFLNPASLEFGDRVVKKIVNDKDLGPYVGNLINHDSSMVDGMLVHKVNQMVYEVENQFGKTFEQLLKEKDKPILLYDTYSDTGYTFSDITILLERFGFTDIKLFVPRDPYSEYYAEEDPDLAGKKHVNLHSIFSQGHLVSKGDNIVSEVRHDSKEDRTLGILMRKEIRQIIKEKSGK